MNEAVTWSFMSGELAEKFGANDNQDVQRLKIKNPINSEWNQMRPTILPNLIEAAGRNHDKGIPDIAIFEVGPAFSSSKITGQNWLACGIRTGRQGNRHWSGPDANRTVDAYDAKADAMAALTACGAPTRRIQITKDAPDWYHPGRSGVIRLGTNILANFGEIHPALLEDMNIKNPIVVGFEAFIDSIPLPKKKKSGTAKPLLEIPQFQPVSRDFAFIVDQNTDTEDIVRAAKSADKELVVGVDIFDIYESEGVEDGKKSVALNVTIQPRDKTLTDTDIESISNRIINNVNSKTGGQIRE